MDDSKASIERQVHDSLSELDYWNAASSTPGAAASVGKRAKKAKVAVTGGVVTGVGLVLIPAPVPLGCVVTAYGVSILATEFDGAQQAFENAKKNVERSLERVASALQVNDDDDIDDDADESDISQLEISDVSTRTESELAVNEGEEGDFDDGDMDSSECTALVRSCSSNHTSTTARRRRSSLQKPLELREILRTRQSIKKKAANIWELHKWNVRKVTSFFISQVVLPTLRNMKVPKPGDEEEDEDPSSSSQQQAEIDVSEGQEDVAPSVAPTEQSMSESSIHSFSSPSRHGYCAVDACPDKDISDDDRLNSEQGETESPNGELDHPAPMDSVAFQPSASNEKAGENEESNKGEVSSEDQALSVMPPMVELANQEEVAESNSGEMAVLLS